MSGVTLESHGSQVADRVHAVLAEICQEYSDRVPEQGAQARRQYLISLQGLGSEVYKDLEGRISEEYSDPTLKRMASLAVGHYRQSCQTGKIFQDIRAM